MSRANQLARTRLSSFSYTGFCRLVTSDPRNSTGKVHGQSVAGEQTPQPEKQ
jgi:hypothetical protein